VQEGADVSELFELFEKLQIALEFDDGYVVNRFFLFFGHVARVLLFLRYVVSHILRVYLPCQVSVFNFYD